ncbi:Early endosome antigen 1 [Camelus dromedarius]|uniref:Early endosome antigen 1 n=1 Tax=Camelus dromedarius TaxID=9838 RepID=A0A5N4DGL1_CAMDR|nr:Early endosome antigen 1 [Camelus dromedarius]
MGKNEATVSQLRSELAKRPQEVAVYVQELQKLKSSVNELTQKNQGFICPQCMKSLGSADELFKHYEAVHDAGNDSSHGGEALALKRYSIIVLKCNVVNVCDTIV